MNFKSFATRSLIALIFGPLIIAAALFGRLIWVGFVLTVVLLSIYEFYELAEKKGSASNLVLGVLTATVILNSLYFYGEFAVVPILILSLLAILFVELYKKHGSPLLNSATTFLGLLIFPLMFGSFILIRELPARYGLAYVQAGRWIVMIILATWVCDTAAYVAGSYLGKHKLMPRISPNKSVEGAVAGFVFAILAAYACHRWFIIGLYLRDSLIIGGIVGSFGQYGDLFESMFKRDAGVKDTSSIIPGHGGGMDRFDSLTITAPVVYLYLRQFVF